MYKLIATVLVFAMVSCTPKDIFDVITDEGGLTTEEVAMGLKEALKIGIKNGSEELAQLDGYYKSPYKIFLPEEAQKVVNKLENVPGFSNIEEKINEKLNRAAEDAAKSAAPIFVDAITSMTIGDAWNILKGEDDAATQYLQAKTYDALYESFQPVIYESLNKVGAADLWEDAVTTYNKIPFVDKLNPRLDDHVTSKALYGLFDMVAKEEMAIREDPAKRVTDLLRKVFAEQDT